MGKEKGEGRRGKSKDLKKGNNIKHYTKYNPHTNFGE
jgi:hypothetical protein